MSRRATNVSRRSFLRGLVAAGGGLVLGVSLADPSRVWAEGDDPQPFEPDVFLTIQPSGDVVIIAHRSEMGTGIRTSLPMVVADELCADWERVSIEQAPGSDKYGSQNTDGSRSIRRFFQAMRVVGATARQMLEQAAAANWGVPASECQADQHRIVHAKSKKSAAFTDLVEQAREQSVPATEALTFKSREDWEYIGKGVPIYDLDGMVDGTAVFGYDVQLEGMKYAAIARCPVLGGKVKALDDSAARSVTGVEDVVQLDPFEPPHAFKDLGGVAVIADNTWAAFEGRKKLTVMWDYGPNKDYDSEKFKKTLMKTANAPAKVMRKQGDVEKGMKEAASKHSADYYVPHLAHASMEPPAAVARVDGDECEAWAPTQNPQAARDTVAQELDLDPKNVTIHVTLLGGGFGRKSKPDFIVEAAKLSKKIGAPVKVVWSREDDVQHDYYHTVAAVHVEAGLDDKGMPHAWLQRSVFPSIMSTFNPKQRYGSALELGLGFLDVPYDIPNLQCENGAADAHVRIGWLRSVAHIYHAFAECSFVDELAHKAKRDPIDYFLKVLGKPRHVNMEGFDYHNHGEPLEKFPIDTGRLAAVTKLVKEKSSWGSKAKKGRGLGFSAHRSFLTYVANVVEVEVAKDGSRISIPRVDIAVDCGFAVHPDRVIAQFEGAAVFGASLALMGEITAKNGRIQQGNYHDYPVARMNEAPREIHVHLINHDDQPPAGAGEPGVPPFAPALCNAVFAATGKRIRELPLSKHDLSWG